ncbi:MAG TPA: TonB-dependent receptor [Blastocatellia bacterium]|nr:TonB-dependent receptor [Blastocatellia bacterium]
MHYNTQLSMTRSAAIFNIALVLASLTPTTVAQTTSGTVVGTVVYDKAGKGVPAALIIALNETNGFRQTARSSDSGTYSVANLPQGYYTLTARKQGFVDDTVAHFAVQFNQKNPVRLPKLTLHTVTLVGRVVDGSDNGLLDAQIAVTNQDGVTRVARTDQYGDYSVSDLPTGRYMVTASYASDKAAHSENIPQTLDRRLINAPTIRLVAVISTAPSPPPPPQPPPVVTEESKYGALIHPTDAARATNFTARQVESLPLGGSNYMRSFDDLPLLAAGVTPPPFTPGVHGPGVGFGIGTAGQFSVNGMRARSNNFSVDGSDNNDPDVGVRRQGFVALVPQPIESVMEVSISTLLWDAELGRNFGSQVNAVSRYGGNKYHGQVFGFFSDSSLNARNPFAGRKEPFTRTQAGFVIDGPIARDRTQFFGSFEHQRVWATTEQHFATPTMAERKFSSVGRFGVRNGENAQVYGPFQGTTPLGDNILSLYPPPNDPGGLFGANTFTQHLPSDGRGDIFSFRLSERISPANALDARYNFTDDDRLLPSVNRAIHSTIESRTRSQNLSLILNSTLGTRVYNLGRISFGRTELNFMDYPGSPFVFSKSSVAQVQVGQSTQSFSSQTGPIGELVIEPYSPVGVGVHTFPQSRVSNTFQFADTMSITAGEHLIKFGSNIRRYQLNSRLDRLYRPQVVYGGALLRLGLVKTDFVGAFFVPTGGTETVSGVELAGLGVASSVLQTLTTSTPNSTIGLRSTEYHFFFNDNWRVGHRLSVDYGLRYEYYSVPHEVDNRIEKAIRLENVPSSGGSSIDSAGRTERFRGAIIAYRRILGGRKQIYEPDYNNFGPHLGFAWLPLATDRIAVRGGYGIYYDAIPGAVVSQSRNVFPNEFPINIDPLFLQFDVFNLNNPLFLEINRDKNKNPITPIRLVRPGACNQFGTCNQLGGGPQDAVALMGQILIQDTAGGLAFTLADKNLRTPYAQQWGLTIEGQAFDDYFFSASYVGTKGTKLTRLTYPNGGPNVTPAIPLASTINGVNFGFPVIFNNFVQTNGFVLRPECPDVLSCPPPEGTGGGPDLRLGAYQIYEGSASSVYHALQLEARTRYAHSYQFTAAYTWSHAMDDVSDLFPIAGAPIVAQDSRRLRLERASANFDIRHRFAGSFIWDLPIFGSSKALLKKLASGWQLSSIFQAHTGQPFTLGVPFDANLDGNLSDRPSTTDGLVFFDGHGARKVAMKSGLAATDFFKLGQSGSVGRNTARGDGFINLDLAMSKRFRLSERHALDFRTGFFNVMNRANFGLPIRTIGAPGFGSAVETAAPARIIQFALKYGF